jgi:uracil phosphoribosyltransferase
MNSFRIALNGFDKNRIGAAEVTAIQILNAADSMLEALKGLTQAVKLNKLNIKEDFSLINAHAAATKAIHKAEGKI